MRTSGLTQIAFASASLFFCSSLYAADPISVAPPPREAGPIGPLQEYKVILSEPSPVTKVADYIRGLSTNELAALSATLAIDGELTGAVALPPGYPYLSWKILLIIACHEALGLEDPLDSLAPPKYE